MPKLSTTSETAPNSLSCGNSEGRQAAATLSSRRPGTSSRVGGRGLAQAEVGPGQAGTGVLRAMSRTKPPSSLGSQPLYAAGVCLALNDSQSTTARKLVMIENRRQETVP